MMKEVVGRAGGTLIRVMPNGDVRPTSFVARSHVTWLIDLVAGKSASDRQTCGCYLHPGRGQQHRTQIGIAGGASGRWHQPGQVTTPGGRGRKEG